MKRAAIVLTLFLAAACGQDRQSATGDTSTSTPAVSASALTPEQLGALGAEIRKEPDRAEELLRQRHLTREQFERAIRDVTENADASRRYAAAYRKASA